MKLKLFLYIFALVSFSVGVGFIFYRYGIIKFKISSVKPSTQTTASTNATTTSTKDSGKGSFAIGGDVMLARWVEQKAAKNGWDNLFSDIKDTFSGDCKIVNLESPVKADKPQTKIGSLVFAAKPESLVALESIAVSAVSLANNHVTDQGLGGFEETTKLLKEKKIAYGGAGTSATDAQKPVDLKCGSIKTAILFATYGANLAADGLSYLNLDDVASIIKKIDKSYDYVIVYPHWGSEYSPTPSPYQKEMAHAYIDAGADLVVGSHPHVLQPVEIYKNKTIVYSLGNMVFDQAPSGVKTEGALLKINVDAGKSNFEIIPIAIEDYYKPMVSTDKADEYKERMDLDSLKWSLKN